MKASVLGVLVSTVAFGGSSLYLWQQLKEERARSEEASQLSRRLNARVAELEKASSEFERNRSATNGGAFGMVELGRGMLPPPPRGAADATTDKAAESPWTMRRHEPSAAQQKIMRVQMRANNRRTYFDLGEKLGLNQEDANKLIDLLTDQQMAGFGDRANSSDPNEARRQFEELQHRQQTEIADTFGADKAEALKTYQESLPARGELDMLSRQFEGTDMPLTDEQRKRMLATLMQERARVPPPEYSENVDAAEYTKAINAWQEEYGERVAADARSFLNTDQLNAYNEYQQWQKEMREQFATANPGGARLMRGVGPGNVMFATAAPVVVSATAVSGTIAVPPPAEAPRKTK